MKHRHENDALSVEHLVRELQKEKNKVVIAYKPQGNKSDAFPHLSDESFLLFIMTDFQATMFEKKFTYCTHKSNPYGFRLVTVVVPKWCVVIALKLLSL